VASHDRIVLIDGYFDQALPVWHKEIPFALQSGREVWGAASQGVLRAAELDSFGMRGVGCVYEWFRDGVLEDDDELAVLHRDAASDYRPLSVPMVTFPATFAPLEQQGRPSASVARDPVPARQATALLGAQLL
jgi:hypothetical protein